MNKKTKRRAYVKPDTQLYALGDGCDILAQSPLVQPGGGNGGSVTIVPLSPDDDDTEISGAKKMTVWEE